ncbi:uncharacterized protein LOC142325438 isoform X2 [Lycorma delicatula]|uniref:uncharacterized protein LOC142325438 isoform X2 n=1 Tax=Lycorma delicatula TaxID=130591 RepID=UPI003F510EDE
MCSFIRDIKCLFYLSSSFIMISAIKWKDRNITKLEFRLNLTQSQMLDYMDYSRIVNLPSSETTSSDFVHEYSSITEEDFYLTKLKSGIVPDLVDKVGNNQYFNDCLAVEVHYEAEQLAVTLGEILTPKQMIVTPVIDWYHRKNQFYTAIMLGLHRLAVVLYEQPGQIVYTDQYLSVHEVDERKHFSTVNFAEKYHLGHPVGGQWWLTEWDSTVEDFYKPDFL